MGLIDHANVSPGDHIFFDNLFTSIPLMIELSQKGIGGCGTMRQNRYYLKYFYYFYYYLCFYYFY